MPRGGWIGVSKKFLRKLKVKYQWQSKVLTVWAKTFGSRKFRCKQPGVLANTWNSLQVLKWTLSERYLTTPLPSGKVKYWGCSFDARRSPLRRSSPNPKRRVGEEDKPTKSKYDRTNHNNNNNNKHVGHKDLSQGSTTPQRSSYVLVVEVTTKVGVSSTSLPLSKQPQRLLELFTKKLRVIQTSQGSFTKWKLLGDA